THFSRAKNGFEYLAADQIVYELPYKQADYQPGACYPLWKIAGQSFYPDYENYVGMNYSISKIEDARATQLGNDVCKATGVPIKILRPDAIDPNKADWTRVATAPGYVQMVHGIVVKGEADDPGGLATILLPPNWDAAAPAGTYPIAFNA